MKKVIHKPTEIVRGKYYTHPMFPKTKYLGAARRKDNIQDYSNCLVVVDCPSHYGDMIGAIVQTRNKTCKHLWKTGFQEIA